MEAADALPTIAEVAMAVTGFAGLLTVFRHRTRKWLPIELFAIRFLLSTSISACLFALLPLPMLVADIPAPTVWTICLGIFGAWIAFLVAVAETVRRSHGFEPRSPFVYWSMISLGFALGLLLIAAAADLFGLRNPGFYLVGLGWLLLVALLQLWIQIVTSLDSK